MTSEGTISESSPSRSESWFRLLTRERVRNYCAIFLFGGVFALVVNAIASLASPAADTVLLPDFLAHWTGGRMLLEGQSSLLYDPAVQQSLQVSTGSEPSSLAWFVAPPFVAAVYLPLALLPYLAACATWTGLSLASLVGALTRLGLFAPDLWARERSLVVLVALASYPTFELLGSGQDSALTLLVWVLGVSLSVRGRQLASGLVFSVGLMKPQLVLLVPVVLLLLRQVRALAAFAGGCVLSTLASFMVAGVHGPTSWLHSLTGSVYADQVTVGQSWKMVSLPALLTAVLGPSGNVATLVTTGLGAAVPLIWFVVRALRRQADPLWCWVAGLATTVVASPHLVVYDAVLLVPVALFSLGRCSQRWLQGLVAAVFCLIWLVPVAHVVGTSAGLATVATAPWIALPVAALWWHVVWRSTSTVGRPEPQTATTA